MVKERSDHKSVAVKNKLFVIGEICTNNCEVFDSTTYKFTLLKQPTLASGFHLYDLFEVITIGSKIFVFQRNSNVKTYDFENNEWSVKTCEATKDLAFFSSVKVPVMKNYKITKLKKNRKILCLSIALAFLACIFLIFYR